MRILFVAPRYHTNQHPLVKALLAKGHEVRFHVLRSSPYENHSLLTPKVLDTWKPMDRLLDRIAQRGRRFDRTNYAFPAIGAYFAKVRAWRPDLMVVRNPQHFSSLIALIAARWFDVRTVLYTQGPVHAVTNSSVRVLRGLISRLAGGHWMSPVLGDTARAPQAHRRFHYVPFAADKNVMPKTGWFRGDRVNILGIGKFVARKNHLLLIRAVERLKELAPVTLSLVGEVSTTVHRRGLEEVENYLREHRLAELVNITVNVQHAAMHEIYLAHDVFVLASRNEPASVAVLEAMAHGLPVMCSTTNGTRHDVKDGVNGYVFESGNEDDLVAKLGVIVSDRALIRSMGAASREIAMTDHDPDLVADRLLALADA